MVLPAANALIRSHDTGLLKAELDAGGGGIIVRATGSLAIRHSFQVIRAGRGQAVIARATLRAGGGQAVAALLAQGSVAAHVQKPTAQGTPE